MRRLDTGRGSFIAFHVWAGISVRTREDVKDWAEASIKKWVPVSALGALDHSPSRFAFAEQSIA